MIADRRRELGVFLRSRRERITPAEAGLPTTARRRTPGLRREEIAVLAGISATWYTYLEQGRDVQPSDQVLSALAAALRLDRPEKDHLFHLAGHAPAQEAEAEPLTAEAAAVPHLLQPNPAYVIGATYDVLSHNEAAAQLFPVLRTAAPNFARWTFTDETSRLVVLDWEREARGLLARLRTLAARHPGDERFTRLFEELREASREVRASRNWAPSTTRTRRSTSPSSRARRWWSTRIHAPASDGSSVRWASQACGTSLVQVARVPQVFRARTRLLQTAQPGVPRRGGARARNAGATVATSPVSQHENNPAVRMPAYSGPWWTHGIPLPKTPHVNEKLSLREEEHAQERHDRPPGRIRGHEPRARGRTDRQR
jgi:transcriptional regulator with XRE-family HTH domain